MDSIISELIKESFVLESFRNTFKDFIDIFLILFIVRFIITFLHNNFTFKNNWLSGKINKVYIYRNFSLVLIFLIAILDVALDFFKIKSYFLNYFCSDFYFFMICGFSATLGSISRRYLIPKEK